MKQFLPSVLFVCFVVFGINATAHYNKLIGNHASGSSESKEFAKKSGGKKTNEKAAALAMTISLTKTDETCPNNGTINATVSGEEAGANVIFEYWNNATPGNVITSTMPLQGLGDGTYTVKAIATGVNVEEVQSEITIVSTYVPIQASSVVTKTCPSGSTGSVIVTVTHGTFSASSGYQIVSAPSTYANALPYTQNSNEFTGLPVGVYQIRVYDTCGLYNTITATVEASPNLSNYYNYFKVSQTDCSAGRQTHSAGHFQFPVTIETTIKEGGTTTGTIVANQTNTFNLGDAGVIPAGTDYYRINEDIAFNTPNYVFPLRVETKITDRCGRVYNLVSVKYNQLALKGFCPPEAGFNWDITNWAYMASDDRDPNAVWPLTIEWVNANNPSETGSLVTTGTPWTGDVTGLTANQTYNVTITDACGKVRTGTVSSGSPPNIGQTAYVEALPSCRDGYFIINYGTENTPTNVKIDQIKVIASSNPANLPVGYITQGNPTLWSFTAGTYPAGHYVFEITMGCVVQTVVLDAPGFGTELTEVAVTPSNTCNSSNVEIFYTFVEEGNPIPNPTGPGSYGAFRYALSPQGVFPTPSTYQASNMFLNVPNGVYDIYMTFSRTPSSQCNDKLMGQVTISNVGPQITSPYGFVCQTGNPNTPFGVIVEATGVGVLEYAITGYNGTPITPVWQTTNQFNSLGQGVYNIEIRDNCATTSTVFSTYSIRQPRITPNNLCPGGNGSLIVTSVPGYVYQWSLNGVPLTNGGHISGVDTNELTFTPFTVPADEGTYSVHVTYQTCVDDIYEIEISGVIPNAGDDITSSACYTNPVIGLNLDTFLSATAMPNGEWTQTSTNGGTLVDNIFDPNGIDPATGPFIFKYRVNGYCGSFDEAVITINFNETVAPTGATAQNFCSADAPTIADLEVTGTDIAWYATQTASDPLAQTTPLVSGTTYYATQTVAGCESFDRVAVTATLFAPPAQPTGNATQEFCNQAGATIADLTATGTGVVWYADATITTVLDPTTLLVDGATYYAGSVANGCESATRLAVTVNFTEVAAPTTSNTAQVFCEIDNATIADIATNEPGVQWFATATSTTPLNATTPLLNGATYFGAITINGCESATRLSVTITITQTPAPTTLNTAQTFCEIDNATIADIVTTETGVEWFATTTSTTPLNATTPLLNGATYFGAITANGCESATRLSVTITITQTPAPTTLNATQTFCEIDNATIADIVTTETGVEWFATATSTTPLNATTPLLNGATYYGAITTNGCESATRLSVTITITQTPAPTTLNAAQTFCEIDNATIADIVTTETGVEWFATATSTTPLNATTPLVSGATYYGAITTNGCESATRLSVTVTITETVAPTTTASSQTFCEIDQATVADLVVSGTGIQWYADATSTTALPSDTVLTNGTYYATQAAASCESATRLAVIVSITATVAPIGNATQTFCEITLPTVANLQATGTGVQWYADAASTTPLTAATPLTDGATYYATQTLNGCESLARLEVTVTITVTPAPTGSSPQAFCQSDNATLADLQATGVGIQWYASATSTTPLALTSVLVDGATYYASQTLNGCESLLRLPITVIIDETPTANAGADQVQYNSGTFVLAGNNPTVGTGTWTVVSGTATFNDPSLFNSAVTIPDNSTATLMWTVVNGTCTVSDEVIISYYIPELEILKSGVFMDTNGDGIDNVGDQIHYTFTVSNTGQTTINNIIVSDPLVAVTGGPISLSAGTSDATTFTAVYNVTQSDIDAGVVYNLATVNGQDPNGGPVTDTSVDPNPLNPSDPLFDPACPDCTVVPIVQEPNMTLTKEGTWQDTDGNGMASVGDTIIYAFTVTNTGNVTLSNISITDPLTGLVLSGGPIITLAPGLSDSTSITGTYAVTQADIEAGAVYNLATATGTDTNGNPISEVSVDPTPIDVNDPLFDPACPDCTVVLLPQVSQIAIIKTGVFNDDNQDNIAQIGETITYSFEVVNTGNMTLYNVTVSDPLPGVILTGGPIAQLLPGQSDTTTFTATYIVTNQDLINGGVTNQALVSATNNAGAVVEDLSDDDSLSENDPTFVPLEGCTLEVFNAITPNEDGVNDTFYIAGIECYPKNKVIIFNRWGVQVYGVDGYNNNDKVFRGYSEGRTTIQQSAGLPVGTYFYVIEYVDFTGKGINKSGHLYIN